MTPEEFVKKYYHFAKQAQEKTGMSAIAIITQSAWETGWGKAIPGNMMFGVKDSDGINGNEQLLTTTEYSRRSDAKFPVIISVTPTVYGGRPGFKYKIKDYFRKYDTPEESFTDHANFLIRNPRYAKALAVKSDPYAFIDAIAAAGYATDPLYASNLKGLAKKIQTMVNGM